MKDVLTIDEIKESYELNNRLKRIIEQYYKLGLVEGHLDGEGRLRLSKEEYENW